MAIITYPIAPVIKQSLDTWRSHILLMLVFAASLLGATLMPAYTPAAPFKPRPRTYKIKPQLRPLVRKRHNGAAPLLPDFNSARYQEVLAAAIVWARGKGKARSETPAIFIQKIREWTEINKAKAAADPRPYRSYQEWCDKNFPAQNFESIQRVVQSLEELGLLLTEQDPECSYRKRYAVNEEAVRDLVDRWAAAHPEIAAHFRGTLTRLDIESPRLDPSTPRLDPESERLTSESHKAVKKGSNQFSMKGASPQGATAAARKGTDGIEGATADSDSHSLSDLRQSPVRASDAPDDVPQDGPIPRSEAPLTQDEAALDQPVIMAVSGPTTPRQVWTTAHHQLSLQLDRPSFDMWLKTAQLRRYEGGVLTVGVPSLEAVQRLQHGYYRKIQRVVEGVANQPVSLTFEVLR